MVGDSVCILHGVTLGGTGNQTGDRHPKVGKSCHIGAGSSILGNIPIGEVGRRVVIGLARFERIVFDWRGSSTEELPYISLGCLLLFLGKRKRGSHRGVFCVGRMGRVRVLRRLLFFILLMCVCRCQIGAG